MYRVCVFFFNAGYRVTVILYLLSQKSNAIQMWRNVARWTTACLENLTTLLDKIDLLNNNPHGREQQVIKVALIREHHGLLNEDYEDFSRYLMTKTAITTKEVNTELHRLRKRRMVRWHVFGAPDTHIVPERSM